MSRHFLSLKRVHRDGKRYIVPADEKLIAFLGLEPPIGLAWPFRELKNFGWAGRSGLGVWPRIPESLRG